MIAARKLVLFLTSAYMSGVAFAQPVDETAICAGMTAIVATWRCSGPAGDAVCTLWGVDASREGKWTDKGRFVIEGPRSVKRVSYAEACIGLRCSRPQYSICSMPVSQAAQIEALLRSGT